MADVNFFDDFERVWGTNGQVEPIDQNQYEQGWAFIGATPPSVEQFNKVQQVSDQKAAWLFAQVKELADKGGFSLAAGITDALVRGIAAIQGHGQCIFRHATVTTAVLMPKNGNIVLIDGAPLSIPAAGVPFTLSGLAANTIYYAYVYASGGTVAGEFSTTGHERNTVTGVEQKVGDSSRSLVGMIRTNASGQLGGGTPEYIRSWFNQSSVGIGSPGNTNSTSSTSYIDIMTNKLNFLTWAGESVYATLSGVASNATANQGCAIQMTLDGSAAGSTEAITFSPVASANAPVVSGTGVAILAEGYHTISAQGKVTGGGNGNFVFAINAAICAGIPQ